MAAPVASQPHPVCSRGPSAHQRPTRDTQRTQLCAAARQSADSLCTASAPRRAPCMATSAAPAAASAGTASVSGSSASAASSGTSTEPGSDAKIAAVSLAPAYCARRPAAGSELCARAAAVPCRQCAYAETRMSLPGSTMEASGGCGGWRTCLPSAQRPAATSPEGQDTHFAGVCTLPVCARGFEIKSRTWLPSVNRSWISRALKKRFWRGSRSTCRGHERGHDTQSRRACAVARLTHC
jgi:hypothetical protein